MNTSWDQAIESSLQTELKPASALPRPPSPCEILERYSKPVFVFDFDGTLVNLASTPEGIHIAGNMLRALERSAERHAVALCSGRAIKDLQLYVPDTPYLDLLGNHGFEWKVGGKFRDLAPQEWWTLREELLPDLNAKLHEQGGWLEDKKYSFSLHYRGEGEAYWTRPEAEAWLRARVESRAQVLEGKMVWNIMPNGTDKGIALVKYAREHQYSPLVYFGDEATDEKVFVRREMEIFGVKVGPEPTAARFAVSDVAAVHAWLMELAEA